MADIDNSQSDLPPASAPSDEPDMVAAPPPQRVRVAWVAGDDTLEELARTLQPLAIGLLDELVEITLICPHGAGVGDLPTPPIELLRHKRLHHWTFQSSTLEWLSKELTNKRVQAIHALDAPSARLARKLSARIGAHYVVSSYCRDDAHELGTLPEEASAVLAASETIRLSLVEHRAAPVEKIRLLHPGVYQVRHATLFENPQQSTAIVAGGELLEYEPFDAVLTAFAEIKNRQYDCVFFLIGSGPQEKDLRLRAQTLGLSDAITFVDWQPPSQLAGILKAADICISPVPLRCIDTQALLAMAAGDAVLAASGGCSDFLIDSRTALLYRMGDGADLTHKLMTLLDDHARARAMAEAALVYLREHHSPAIMVSEMGKLYRHIAQETPAPAVVL